MLFCEWEDVRIRVHKFFSGISLIIKEACFSKHRCLILLFILTSSWGACQSATAVANGLIPLFFVYPVIQLRIFDGQVVLCGLRCLDCFKKLFIYLAVPGLSCSMEDCFLFFCFFKLSMQTLSCSLWNPVP